MKKQFLTFVLGAAAGGSTIAFVSRKDTAIDSKAEQKFPEAAITYLKQGSDRLKQAIDKTKEGNRFIERSSRKTGWESFDLSPTQEWNWNWDYRHYDEIIEPSKTPDSNNSDTQLTPKVVRPTATRHLVLIRHGQYNLDGKTDDERYLTPLGREQARSTGERIANLNLPLTSIVSSTMTRAQETANLIRPFLPDDLKSLPNDSILCEGAPFPPVPSGSWKPEVNYYTDGSRIEAAFRKYFHRADKDQKEDSFEVIVCHANVIRYFVCRALQLPPEAWLRISLKHGSMTWITIRPDGRTSIRTLGESGYMPPDKLTTTWTVSPF